jgi:hypothetical protein
MASASAVKGLALSHKSRGRKLDAIPIVTERKDGAKEYEPRKLTMSITLDLPQELESELAAEATQLGLSLTEYALRLLVTRTRASHMPTTGAELVAYWQREGVIGTRPEITDSQMHARQIRHRAERRVQG